MRNVVFSDSNGVLPAGWPWLFSNWRGERLLNRAIAGSSAVSAGRAVYTHTPAAGDRHFLALGTNDARTKGGGSGPLALYGSALAAEIYWLGGTVLRGQSAGWTYTGAWSNDWTSPPITVGKFSLQAGSTASAAFDGNVLMLGTLTHAPGGTFRVDVDGVTAGIFNALAPAPVNISPEPGWSPGVVRYTGFGPGQHTVLITTLASGTALAVDWLWTGSPNGCPVYVLTVPRMGVGHYPNSDPMIAAYNAVIGNLVTQAQGDGLDVEMIDSSAWVDPTVGDLLTDDLHYSAQGMLNVAGSVTQALTE